MKRAVAILAVLYASLAAAAPGSSPARPEPGDEPRSRALAIIHEVYKADYQSRDPARRRDLARRMIDEAAQTRDDPAAISALLREARDLATAAGDPVLACQAIDARAGHFDIDTLDETLSALSAILRDGRDPENLAHAARIALKRCDDAIRAEAPILAERLAGIAAGCAGKAQRPALARQAEDQLRVVDACKAELRNVQAGRDVLAKKPGDPAACLVVGRFLCFTRDDWPAGLPLLAKCADERLAKLAQKELANPPDAPARCELANGWWELADESPSLARRHLRARSAHWYRLAMPKLAGLPRSLAAARLDEVERQRLADLNLRPGLRAQLFKGLFAEPVGQRVDVQVDFDFGEDAPDPALTKDHFAIRWTGRLVAPASGKHAFVVIANTGVRLWIDDKLILDEDNLTRQRNGQRIEIELPAGDHPFRLDYWDTTGLAKVRLLWQPPGAASPAPIPPAAFYHDE